MPVLLFQMLIVLTLVIARYAFPKAMIYIATGWTAFSLIMIFMPWLMILQLSIIWSGYLLLRPKKSIDAAVRAIPRKGERP